MVGGIVARQQNVLEPRAKPFALRRALRKAPPTRGDVVEAVELIDSRQVQKRRPRFSAS